MVKTQLDCTKEEFESAMNFASEIYGSGFVDGFVFGLTDKSPETLGIKASLLGAAYIRDLNKRLADRSVKLVEGEKVIYRNFSSGDVVVTIVKLRENGKITVNNGTRYFAVMGRNLSPLDTV